MNNITENPFQHLRYDLEQVLRADQRYVGDAGLGPEIVSVVYNPVGTSDQIVLYPCLHCSGMWAIGWVAYVGRFRSTQHASVRGGLFRDVNSAKLFALGEITAEHGREVEAGRIEQDTELKMTLYNLVAEIRQKTIDFQ